VPRPSGATAVPWGAGLRNGDGALPVCPITGLCPRSAAAPAPPLPGRAGLEFSDTRAERLPPGIAGPLKTCPNVPSPPSGPLPVAKNSTAMIEAGIRTATSEAP
jgi:hypothetical protein